jgi:8-oxo-dGTP diphosphatase
MSHLVRGAALADAEATADRLVTLVILRVGGGYVLQLRDHIAGIANPGHWGLFGGSIEPGESPEQGARREIEEELGLPVEVRSCPFGVLDPHNSFHGVSVCALTFRGDVTAVWDRHVLREGQRVQVFEPAELADLEPVGELSRLALTADLEPVATMTARE